MPFLHDWLAILAQYLVFLCALAGPERNPARTISVEDKLRALSRLSETGETKGCEAILQAIRAKKTDAEATHAKYVRANEELQEAIANDLQSMRVGGARAKAIQEIIDARIRTLQGWSMQEARFRQLIDGHAREERAFNQLYQHIKATQAGKRTP